jgi:hypothetical protein
MHTVQDKIEIGLVSTYLALVDVLNGSIFGKKLDQRLPQMLAMETDAVRWQYETDPNDITLIGTSNYLISLCGNYYLRAVAIIAAGGSGGSVTPIMAERYQYAALEYTVTDIPGDGNPQDGETTFYDPRFIGAKNFAYIIAGAATETEEDGQVSLNTTTGILTRSNTFSLGESIIVPILQKL